MPRGGARANAGRKKGGYDKPRKAAVSDWQSSVYGLPTKRMLYASNYYFNMLAVEQKKSADQRDAATMKECLVLGTKYAAMAAPYLERRLASISHQLLPFDLSKLNDSQLSQLEQLIELAATDGGNHIMPQPASPPPTPKSAPPTPTRLN